MERKDNNEIQRRFLSTDLQLRNEDASEAKVIEGYAALYNEDTEIYGYVERIAPGAFDGVLGDDVRALFNHDMNFPLARCRDGEGTLQLKSDERGLHFSFEVGPQQYAQDLHASIMRGDVSQASFGFWIGDESWELRDDVWYCTITRVERLIDVSPVTYPAYKQTEISARSADRIPAKPSKSPDGFPARSVLSVEIDILKLKQPH